MMLTRAHRGSGASDASGPLQANRGERSADVLRLGAYSVQPHQAIARDACHPSAAFEAAPYQYKAKSELGQVSSDRQADPGGRAGDDRPGTVFRNERCLSTNDLIEVVSTGLRSCDCRKPNEAAPDAAYAGN